ncbi:MAG: NUDIX domain-containing protein [Anaerolineaceae bacterium]|nr:NUDIX domain-containing protein [Anaerolineaceae bacterium]MBN2678413.1 NUDIX domain-containing protein [Anaerolineaceae bacterium]
METLYCLQCGTVLEKREWCGSSHLVCPDCDWVYFEDPKVAVGVLVEQKGQILLVKRKNEPMPGYWSIPAGFMNAHEDPRKAAERECLEETGLRVEAGKIASVIDGREHPKGADIVIAYHAIVLGGILQAGDDAEEVAFFSRDSLPPLAFRATRIILETE